MVLAADATPSRPDTVSLDRIDSLKGYTSCNVELVPVFINLGKNQFSKQQVVDFINQFLGQHVP